MGLLEWQSRKGEERMNTNINENEHIYIMASGRIDELQRENAVLRRQLEVAINVIKDGQDVVARGVELMTLDELSCWNGVRSWQEQSQAEIDRISQEAK
jgi:hypothetical protein